MTPKEQKSIDFLFAAAKSISPSFAKLFTADEYDDPMYNVKFKTITCKELLGNLPKFYGSFITQFGAITKQESMFLFNSLKLNNINNKKFNLLFSEKVLKAIFKIHKTYDNAMFADYELIGINNLNNQYKKQIPIFFLRPALDGKLTLIQKFIAKIFGVKHVTYEHRHPNKHSKNMLNRNQSWKRFFKILIYFYIKFKVDQIKFNLKYLFSKK